ncbi:MAG: hypothetical protein KDA98_15975, partial [Acidimicrobiales bacterium]|nr:hypothetical protein [Acidimicrobiales bacterium]
TPLSPDDGFAYDGLVRNTGVMVDTAGNVWLANNWKLTPPPTNPAGFQVVVYLGLATPVTPPEPIERPTPEPEPEPGPTPAVPIAARPDYTG